MSDLHQHRSAEDVAAYFRGLLDADGAHALEEHCAVCQACAEQLMREARLEVVLYEVAEQHRAATTNAKPRPSRASFSKPRRGAVGAALLAAAGIAVLVTRSVPFHSASSVDGSIGKDSPPPSSTESSPTPPMRNALATATTATTMFILSAPMPGCSACAPGSPASSAAGTSSTASSASTTSPASTPHARTSRVVPPDGTGAGAAVASPGQSTQLTLTIGERKKVRVPDIETYHLDTVGVAGVLFTGDDVAFEGQKAGNVTMTFFGRDKTVTSFVVHVVEAPSASAPLPIDLRIGDSRVMRIADITAFHHSEPDVVNVAFSGDNVVIDAKKVGTDTLTFFAKDDASVMYTFHVSAEASGDAGASPNIPSIH